MTTIVLKKELEERLEHLAQERRQPLSAVVTDMVEACLEVDEWHRRAIEEAVKRADSGDTKRCSLDEVEAWVESWDTGNELPAPECR